MMKKVKSCGIIVFRRQKQDFLLLRHTRLYDLPKGHVEQGESEIECALRELQEETGILKDDVALDPHFRYETKYYPKYRRFGGERVEKTLVVFLAFLQNERKLFLGEHESYEWIRWAPPHTFQEKTIEGLMLAVQNFFESQTKK